MISTREIKAKSLSYQLIEDDWLDKKDWDGEWVEGTRDFTSIVRYDWLRGIEKSKLIKTLEVALVHMSDEEDYWIVNGFGDRDREPIYDLEKIHARLFNKYKYK